MNVPEDRANDGIQRQRDLTVDDRILAMPHRQDPTTI